MMDFELIGELSDVEISAVNLSIRENAELKVRHGGRRWRKLKGFGTVRLAGGSVRRAELHWYEAQGIGPSKAEDQAAHGLKFMAHEIPKPIFAVCVANDGSDDLSICKLYRLLADDDAAGEGMLRVVDDSGEDYLYAAGRFVIVSVPRAEEGKLLAITPEPVA